MEYVVTIILSILTIIIIKIGLNVKIKDINKIKKIGYDKDLNEITNKLPENIKVCQSILKQLENTDVNIKTSDDKDNKLSYYTVATNTIIIANIKDTFTRIQTIAHECIHSTQNRRTLLFNFIFSNIYIIYFLVISILTLLNIIKYPMIQLVILIMLGIIYYSVRSYLETDAMTKAPYIAKQYMQESKAISEDEIATIIKNYNQLNKIGIPMTNFQLIWTVIIKIIIYCVIAII